jgi:hypothetical protein
MAQKNTHLLKIFIRKNIVLIFATLLLLIISLHSPISRNDQLTKEIDKVNTRIAQSLKSSAPRGNETEGADSQELQDKQVSSQSITTDTEPIKTNNSDTGTSTFTPTPQNSALQNGGISPTPTSQISGPVSPTPPTATPTQSQSTPLMACTSSGGTWKTLPDSCVDSCTRYQFDAPMCLTVLTDGCDCGPDRCWDGTTCTANAPTPTTP